MKIAAVLLASAIAIPCFGGGQTADSPLVAASRRTNRAAKKSAIVITNETLAHAGASAHVTTTKVQPVLAKLPAAAAPQPAAPAAAAVPPPKVAAKPKANPHDDADSMTEGLDDEPIVCPSCLPILGDVPHGLALRKAEFSTSPPRIVPPQPPPDHQQ
jgi:hypothetical protein